MASGSGGTTVGTPLFHYPAVTEFYRVSLPGGYLVFYRVSRRPEEGKREGRTVVAGGETRRCKTHTKPYLR